MLAQKTARITPFLGHWPLAEIPPPLMPYLELTRLTEPLELIITLLIFNVGLLYGACLTKPLIRPYDLLGLACYFNLYALVMRHGLLALNDTVDADHERKICRTSSRPIPRGAITKNQGFALSYTLIGLGAGILLLLPKQSYMWALVSTMVMSIYAFVKRALPCPTLLGWGYTFAVFQGVTTAGADFSLGAEHFWKIGSLGLAISNLVVVANTLYAFQDIREHAKKNIKSLPWTLSRYNFTGVYLWIAILAMHVQMSATSFSAFFSIRLFSVINSLLLFVAMMALVDLRIPADCRLWYYRVCLGPLLYFASGFAVEYGLRVYLNM